MGPEVREMMLWGYLPLEIYDFIAEVMNAQKPDALERFKAYRLQLGWEERRTEEAAKEMVESIRE